MRTLHWIKHEMHMQFKNGMYAIYFLVNIFYLIVLHYVPIPYKEIATTFVLMTDPVFLGMIFVGAIFLLEKVQGIPKGIGISPLGSGGYIISKVCSLIVISIIMASIIVMVVLGDGMRLVGVLISVVLGGSLFTLMGIILGTYAKTTNMFLVLIAGCSMVLALPFISFYETVKIPIIHLIPSYSVLRLMSYAVEGRTLMIVDCAYLVGWVLVIGGVTRRVVQHKIFA